MSSCRCSERKKTETSLKKKDNRKVGIIVEDKIETVCPSFVGACIEADVENSAYSEELWKLIDEQCEKFRQTLTTDTVKDISAIAATRRVYKACGKDPSRYRPSSEALIRRVLQGKQLYQIDTLVDLINLASITYGYSIGGFDAGKFSGDTLSLGVGREGEPYEGIGRGLLNIAGLPVYRDAIGGVGTPTSDNERTKMGLATRRLVALVNGYDGNEETVRATAQLIIRLVERFCNGRNARYFIYR